MPNPRDHLFAEEAHRALNHVIGHRAKLSGRHEVLVRLKTGFDREKFDFPADFGSLREGLGMCSGHVKAVTGDLDGRSLSSARRSARAARSS